MKIPSFNVAFTCLAATVGAGMLLATLPTSQAFASTCPSVDDPQGFAGKYSQQLEIEEFAAGGGTMTYNDNPLFASRVASGALPAVADRLPSEPLIVMPYNECGKYGGMLRGLSKAIESGTSEILSWRHVNLVRIGDDLQALVPNVAKSWEWADDFSTITVTLRKGHKWSDGAPFTTDDVEFYFNDLILNKELHATTPSVWVVEGKPVKFSKIDAQTFMLDFGAPNPGLLHFLATGGSYFAPYAPKHHYMKYHITYNPNADEEAKAEGNEGWVQRFSLIWSKWKDTESITPHALIRPTLESHIVELETTTQRRQLIANPYFFKVDTAGNQLPYIDRHNERFLSKELMPLAIMNGEVDEKAQTVSLRDYPVLKENEDKGGYHLQLPGGGTGSAIVFSQTHQDPRLRTIYGDLRFRNAMSVAINRDELNEVLWLGLGKPEAALPIGVAFVTDADRNHMIQYDPALANELLDAMGMVKGSEGVRTGPDGKPFTILWEYSSQFASSDFVTLVSGYWGDVGINVTAKEITSQLTREKAAASASDINMEWDVPFEPNLISQIDYYIPPYGDIGPLTGVQWGIWFTSGGSDGEVPPAHIQRLFKLSAEWKTLLPGSDRYMEVGAEMVRINLDNMMIIGTVAELPNPTVISNRLRNVTQWTVQNYNYGRAYAFRPDQWYFAE